MTIWYHSSTLVAATESECLGVSQTSWDKKVCFWPFMEKTIDWKLSPMKEWYQGAIWWRFFHYQQVEFFFAVVQSLLFFLLIHWFPSCCMANISQFRESEKNCSSKGKEVHRFSKLRWIVSCKKIMIWNAVAIIMWSRTDFSFNLSFAFEGRSARCSTLSCTIFRGKCLNLRKNPIGTRIKICTSSS